MTIKKYTHTVDGDEGTTAAREMKKEHDKQSCNEM